MKAFKLYVKIFVRNIKIVLVYVLIFLFITVVMSVSSGESSLDFSSTKISVAYKNNDQNSELTQALVKYLKNYTVTVDVQEKNYADALYFRNIASVIVIPEDFETRFLNSEEGLIYQDKLQNKFANVTIEREINKYLNNIRVFMNQTDMDLSEAIIFTDDILLKEVNTEMQIVRNTETEATHSYFNFISYIIFSITLTIVGIMTLKLRNEKIKRRMVVSPYPIRKSNLEFILGNVVFTSIFVFLIFITSMILYPNVVNLNGIGIIYLVNLLTFSIAVLAIAYFLSLLIKNEAVLVAVNNILALGMAFASGAFVPQEILGKGLLFVSKITPSYYYINNNIKIYEASSPDLNLIVMNCLIQLIFTAVFVVLAIYINMRQLKNEE
ncbi:MAG: ABC transporter permease [Bacilli bacterium]